MRILALILFGWLALGTLSHAGDYVFDPNARNYEGRADLHGEPFKKPQDMEVCPLYLQNLRYFAENNLPMSCGQPVAPKLASKIKPVQWENLDPQKYPELFKEVVKRVFPPGPSEKGTYPSESDLSSWRKAVRTGSVVFRRAKLKMKGYMQFPPLNVPKPLAFQIVQFGINVTDPANPEKRWRCKEEVGRSMQRHHQTLLRIFVTSQNLEDSYGELYDSHLGFGPYLTLWIINDRPYGELYDDKGNVLLSEISLKPEVLFERICLFHYKTN